MIWIKQPTNTSQRRVLAPGHTGLIPYDLTLIMASMARGL
jgi:hypothetical protein